MQKGVCSGLLYLFLSLFFSCSKPVDLLIVGGDVENDIVSICKSNGVTFEFYEELELAVAEADKGQGLFVLSSGGKIKGVSEGVLDEIEQKQLRLFVEFGKKIADLEFKDSTLIINKERAVVNTDKIKGLQEMDVLSLNNNEMLLLEEESIENPLLVMAKVAGYDTAEYGLDGTDAYPLLFEYNENVLVSAMRLSNVMQGRFGPSEQWEKIYSYILSWLCGKDVELQNWQPSVYPAYAKHEDLSKTALKASVKQGVDWYYNAKLLVDSSWVDLYEKNTSKNGKHVVHPPVADNTALGAGLNGILEGHASRINPDGSQPYRWWVRADCQAETAFALSSAALFLNDRAYGQTAKNLLQYLFKGSNLRQGERNDPESPSFGLIGWATTDPDAYYGDDNARALLAAIGASSNLDISLWDEKIIEGILGNFRTAGVKGFRGPWFRDAKMQETTWQALGQRDIVNIHPHYESWLWAMYLWMYDKTDYVPFLEKAKTAISITMSAFPNWKWTNGVQQEYARMILPLAWLVRVEDTQEHREWLDKVILKIMEDMDKSGAIPERLGQSGFGRYEKITSNAEYGTKEAPLISSEKNKVSDLLYTMNFAFFSLNEAAHATGKERYKKAVESIADYMIRIQVSSRMHNDLNGAWFRAFDYEKWEYWASNADSDWGPWGTVTGWTQSWIVNGLINKETNTSLWDISKKKYNNGAFKTLALSKMKSMLWPKVKLN